MRNPLSNELQLGKAGEHLVCADLILQGFNAFLADQGLPYDVVADTPTGLKRVQVKSTCGLTSQGKSFDVFRFGIRRGRHYSRSSFEDVDAFAFVALSTKQIAYRGVVEMRSPHSEGLISLVEFRTKAIQYAGRVYPNGTVRTRYGRFIEDYSEFRV